MSTRYLACVLLLLSACGVGVGADPCDAEWAPQSMCGGPGYDGLAPPSDVWCGPATVGEVLTVDDARRRVSVCYTCVDVDELNEERAAGGLPPVGSVSRWVVTASVCAGLDP